MAAKDTPAEALLKRVRKLEDNLTCPNCGTYNQFGFGSVCVKFKTFVCDLCKTSHQAISHRCKSITMSTWTMVEVQELTMQCGGGNHAALQTWLLHAPHVGERYTGGRRPKTGDKIEIFKKFIEDCYERQMFKSSTPYTPSESPKTLSLSEAQGLSESVTAPPKRSSVKSNSSLTSVKKSLVSAPPVDLLDFDSSPSVPTSPGTGTIASGSVDVFGDWSSASASASAPAQTMITNSFTAPVTSNGLLDMIMTPSVSVSEPTRQTSWPMQSAPINAAPPMMNRSSSFPSPMLAAPMMQPSTMQPSMMQPSMMQPSMMQPSMMQPPMMQPPMMHLQTQGISNGMQGNMMTPGGMMQANGMMRGGIMQSPNYSQPMMQPMGNALRPTVGAPFGTLQTSMPIQQLSFGMGSLPSPSTLQQQQQQQQQQYQQQRNTGGTFDGLSW